MSPFMWNRNHDKSFHLPYFRIFVYSFSHFASLPRFPQLPAGFFRHPALIPQVITESNLTEKSVPGNYILSRPAIL